MKWTAPARAALAGVAVAAAAVVPAVGAASATNVPFTDHNAVGYIGLCNTFGQSITSGSLLDDPFVWTAVSSAPAPSGYEQAKATLYVFQPRQNVDPGQWSGEQVTGSSTFTNPSHPMVQATSGDTPLISVDGAFPPRWNGLYQLRIYFTGVNLEPYTQHYPATVIQVTGNKWSVVQGGTVPCNSGKATSSEVAGLNDPSLKTPQSVPVVRGAVPGAPNSSQVGFHSASSSTSPGAVPGAQASGSGATAAAGNPARSGGLAAGGRVGTATGKSGGLSGGTIAALVLIGVAVLAGGGAGLALWRRRTTGEPVPTGR